jgi:hypothetical protein
MSTQVLGTGGRPGLHTAGATGSIPVPPTIKNNCFSRTRPSSRQSYGTAYGIIGRWTAADSGSDHFRRFSGRAGKLRWPGWGILIPANPALAAVRAGGHPGGICLGADDCAADPADRLAIHPNHPLDLTLARPVAQQRLHRNPQVRLQDVHSPSKREQRNVRRNRAPGADRRPLSSGVEEFQVLRGGGV